MSDDMDDYDLKIVEEMLGYDDPDFLYYFNDENWMRDTSPSSSSDQLLSSVNPIETDSSNEVFPSVNSMEMDSSDIPIDQKEWLITDEKTKRKRPPRLCEFLILLLHKIHYMSYASYKNKDQGVFEIHQPEKVANLWQNVKNRQSNQPMTYDKFARAIRWYYEKDVMRKTNARHTFQFSPKTLAGITTDENNNIIIKHSV